MHEIKPKRMLVVLAHPDDESCAVGGTLAKFAAQDVQVVLLSATCGEAGLPGVKPAAACEIRERELKQAAGYLGVEPYFLDCPDEGLADLTPEMMTEAIACWMDLVQPQVILTFGPDGVSGHPDHILISSIVTHIYDFYYKKGLLVYIRPSEATVLGLGVGEMKLDEDKPQMAVDISEYKSLKVRAIQSHGSQEQELSENVDAAAEQIPAYEVFTIARHNLFHGEEVDWFDQ